jgi:hypothetical protein
VGLGKEGVAKVIAGCPNVLGMSVKNNIAPKVRYLQEEMGLGKEGAAKVIFKFPKLLGYSVDNNLRPTVKFLVEEAGAGPEGAADIILQIPSLLGMSIELNLRPTLHFLVDNFPGISGVQAMKLAAHSLVGKLLPRVRLLESVGQTGRFAASSVAVLTTPKFCEKVGVTLEEYNAEVEVCKIEHQEMYPSPAGAAAEEAGKLMARAMDDAMASNKAESAKRNAKRRAKLMATKSRL